MSDLPSGRPPKLTRDGFTAEEVLAQLMSDDNTQMVMEEDGSIYFRCIADDESPDA